jgi:hypothetical protein
MRELEGDTVSFVGSRTVILSRAEGEGSFIVRESTSRFKAPSVRAGLALSARFEMTRERLAQSATLVG